MTDRTQPMMATPTPVEDLPLYWQVWANAIKLMEARRAEPDAASLRQAAAYEKCAEELRAALQYSALAQRTREQALEQAALEFIAKVDRGEARSTQSYAAFKAALSDTSTDRKPAVQRACNCQEGYCIDGYPFPCGIALTSLEGK